MNIEVKFQNYKIIIEDIDDNLQLKKKSSGKLNDSLVVEYKNKSNALLFLIFEKAALGIKSNSDWINDHLSKRLDYCKNHPFTTVLIEETFIDSSSSYIMSSLEWDKTVRINIAKILSTEVMLAINFSGTGLSVDTVKSIGLKIASSARLL